MFSEPNLYIQITAGAGQHPTTMNSGSQQQQQQQHEYCNTKQENQNYSNLPSIKLPSSNQQFNNDVKEHDEPTTPMSSDHKIPIPKCPPAPRKPRSSNKRKTASVRRISVDLMVVLDAMFVQPEVVDDPGIVAGDFDGGERVKKVKKAANVTIG